MIEGTAQRQIIAAAHVAEFFVFFQGEK